MADGRGGARPGAGRKPKAIREIRNRAIEEAGENARYAMGLFISVMENPKQPMRLRLDCAKEVADRVFGKATQRNENVNDGDLRIIIEHVSQDPDTSAAR